MSTPAPVHDYSNSIDIHEASELEVQRINQFMRELVEPCPSATSPADPYLVSLRHELTAGHLPQERFVEYVAYINGEIAARCEINYQSQSDDINAYGPVAANLYANERLAILAGDLVSTNYRRHGLHAAMIKFRLTLLTSMNYSYAMCGILDGNNASKDNYLRAGFTPIGEKNIDWGKSCSNKGEGSKRVVLYGLRL